MPAWIAASASSRAFSLVARCAWRSASRRRRPPPPVPARAPCRRSTISSSQPAAIASSPTNVDANADRALERRRRQPHPHDLDRRDGNRHADRHLDGLASRLRGADAVVAAEQQERAHRDGRARRGHDRPARETSADGSDSSKPPASMPAPPPRRRTGRRDRSKPPLNTRWLPAITTALSRRPSRRGRAPR